MLQKAPVSMDQLQRLLRQPQQYPHLSETDVEDFVNRLRGTFDDALLFPLLCTQVAVLKAYPQLWQLCLHLLVLSSSLQHACLLLAHLCTRQTDTGLVRGHTQKTPCCDFVIDREKLILLQLGQVTHLQRLSRLQVAPLCLTITGVEEDQDTSPGHLMMFNVSK